MKEDVKTVISFYQNYNEDDRMSQNPLEYVRCKEIISRYLTKNSMCILDVGGATGAFSFWIAEQGHRVSLIDFAPKHIDIAQNREREKGIYLTSSDVGDARELPYEDNSFDLVLLMGPMYHLIEKSERLKALQEAYRVLNQNGKLLCEVISRYASMVDGFQYGFVNDPDFVQIMERDMTSGIHIDTSSNKSYFTNAYFHKPDEVVAEIKEAGFVFNELIAVTSFGSMITDIDNKMKDEKYRDILLNTIRLVEKDDSLMGISSHCIGIGEKIVERN